MDHIQAKHTIDLAKQLSTEREKNKKLSEALRTCMDRMVVIDSEQGDSKFDLEIKLAFDALKEYGNI